MSSLLRQGFRLRQGLVGQVGGQARSSDWAHARRWRLGGVCAITG